MKNTTNYFSPSFLFSTPLTPPSAYFGALTVFFGVLFVVSALVYWRRAKLAPDNPVRRRLIRRLAKAGMWSGGIGLFLALMRYVEMPYLAAPILMYLLVLGMIVTVGYFVYELSEKYPLASWQLEESRLQRRYRPTPQRQAQPVRVRSKRRR